jgi:hypothetical protein
VCQVVLEVGPPVAAHEAALGNSTIAQNSRGRKTPSSAGKNTEKLEKDELAKICDDFDSFDFVSVA